MGPWRIVAIGAAAWLGIAAAPAADVADLGWLSGSWISESDGDAWTEELWTEPRGGLLLGVNRTGTGDRAAGFEYMRIAADPDGAIGFWGSPGGKPPVEFRLTSSRPGEAVFENPAHDFPTRIVYRREGEALVATVSGPEGTDSLSWRFRRNH